MGNGDDVNPWMEAWKWILFVFDLCALPIYALVLVTIIKWRKHPSLDSPFYKFVISIGVADMLHTVHSWLAFRIYPWGWLFGLVPDTRERDYDRSTMLVTVFLTGVQTFGIVLIAFERLTVIFWPFKHAAMWRADRTVVLCALQWVMAALTAVPCYGLRISWTQRNETVRYINFANRSSELSLAVYTLGSLTFLVITAFVVPVIYMLTFYYAWHYHHRCTTTIDDSSSGLVCDARELRRCIAGFLMDLSLVCPFLCAFIAALSAYLDYILMLYCTAQDYSNNIKPFILLATSGVLRARVQRQCPCQPGDSVSEATHTTAGTGEQLTNAVGTRMNSAEHSMGGRTGRVKAGTLQPLEIATQTVPTTDHPISHLPKYRTTKFQEET